MMDYHVLSMDSVGAPVTDNGVALHIKDIPWAGRQLWAPDAAYANGTYHLYFPVKKINRMFFKSALPQAVSLKALCCRKEPIKGSYSIDPCVFKDDDGNYYMYFGGIWGGNCSAGITINTTLPQNCARPMN